MIEKNNIGWFAHPQFSERAKLFEERYQMIDCIINDEASFKKKKMNGRYGDHCLFCGKSHPEATFNNAPHLLSRLLGSSLYSNFECDNCNGDFSKFETDVSSYLGLGRSITGIKGDRKAPGFPGRGIKAKTLTFKGRKISVIYTEDAEQNVDAGTSKLNYGKPTYTPANVYRVFLKWALSLLPNYEVRMKYSEALAFLKNGKVLNGSHICVYRYTFTVKMLLHAYIFKKIEPTDKVPTHVVSIYFDNIIITLPLPLHKDDMQFYTGPIDMPIAPPYFIGGNDMGEITGTTSIEDLSSPHKLVSEPEEITMQFRQEYLNNAVRYNPITGEENITKYNPSGSKYMIATDHGVSFTKDELKELLAVIEEKFSS